MSKARNWLFTLNNPEGLPDGDELLSSGVTYAVFQEEVGENGTHHLQGYVELERNQALSYVTKLPGLEGAHFEQRRGKFNSPQNAAKRRFNFFR